MKIWLIFLIFILILIFGGVFLKITDHQEIKPVNLTSSINLSVSSCNLLSNSSEKENCYLSLVKVTKDESVCRLISEVQLRGDCYLIAKAK